MKNDKGAYILIPAMHDRSYRLTSKPPIQVEGRVWEILVNVAVGGYFYDHICDTSGQILGIRYWGASDDLLSGNFVLSHFLKDKRFFFAPDGAFADILFNADDIEPFKRQLFRIDTLQDFGGEQAVKRKRRLVRDPDSFAVGTTFNRHQH